MFTHLAQALIALTTLLPTQPAPPPTTPRLELDQIFRDRMSIHDPTIHTPTLDTYYVQAPTVGRRFTFEAPETRRYEISHISYFYDSYLTVRTPNGKILAENDDGPVAGHALLTFEANEGETYIIEAGALHGHAGPFELVIRVPSKARTLLNYATTAESRVYDAERRARAYEVEYGPEHPSAAMATADLGAAYYYAFKFKRALNSNMASLVNYEMTFGPGSLRVATLLDNTGLVYRELNELNNAETLHRRALSIFERSDPVPSDSVIVAQHNLAGTLLQLGRAAEARHYFEQALHGHTQRQTLNSLQSLVIHAGLMQTYSHLGDIEAAQSLLQRATAIVDTLPSSMRLHPAVLSLMFAKTQHHFNLGELGAARIAAESLCEQLRFAPHLGLSVAYTYLAACYYDEDQPALALDLYRKAHTLHTQQYGQDSPDSIKARYGIAMSLSALGESTEARRLSAETVELATTHLGSLHPVTLASKHLHVRLLANDPDSIRSSADLCTELLDELRTKILREMTTLPEHERLLLLARHRLDLSHLVSLATGSPIAVPVDIAYSQVLKWKGIVSRGAIQDRERWLRKTLTRDGTTSNDDRAPTKPNASITSPESLRNDLLPRDALLDFVTVARLGGEHHVVCFVSTRESTKIVNLGEADELTRKIEFVNDSIVQRSDSLTTIIRDLHDQVWSPIETLLAEKDRILITPDGPIGQVSFASLLGSNGRFLVEDYEILYHYSLSGSTQRGGQRDQRPGSNKLLVVGGIDYDVGRGLRDDEPAPQRETRVSLPAPSPEAFPYLAESGNEAAAIETLFHRWNPDGECIVLSGAEASETAFVQQTETAATIHVATHGFFASKTLLERAPEIWGLDSPLRDIRPASRSSFQYLIPSLTSGIALSGANRTGITEGATVRTSPDDGLLTAEEISWLDLRNCDLVVLSACDTGLGKSVPGEHLLGLRRALRLAGARESLTSLWRIDDKGAREFMLKFYSNIWEHELSPTAALREAQLEFLRRSRASGRSGDPAIWAAFILEGDWTKRY